MIVINQAARHTNKIRMKLILFLNKKYAATPKINNAGRAIIVDFIISAEAYRPCDILIDQA